MPSRAEEALHHLELARTQAEVGDGAPEVALVQDPDDDLLAASGDRDRGHAEIHGLSIHARGRVPVVRPERIRHVELGPDLHPADEGCAGRLGQAHDLTQHAVHAVADDHAALGGLGVDVARAFAHAVADHRVDQLGNRGVEIALRCHGNRVRVHGFDPRRLEPAEQALDRALGAVELVDPLGQRGGRRDLEGHLAAGDEPERLLEVEVTRIGAGDLDRAVVGGERYHLVLARQRLRHEGHRARVGRRQVGQGTRKRRATASATWAWVGEPGARPRPPRGSWRSRPAPRAGRA